MAKFGGKPTKERSMVLSTFIKNIIIIRYNDIKLQANHLMIMRKEGKEGGGLKLICNVTRKL